MIICRFSGFFGPVSCCATMDPFLEQLRDTNTAAREGSPPCVARAVRLVTAGGGIFRGANTAAQEGSPPCVARAVRPVTAGGGKFRDAITAAREGSPPCVAGASVLANAGGGKFRNPDTTIQEEAARAIRLATARLATFGGLPSWATVLAILGQFRFSPMDVR